VVEYPFMYVFTILMQTNRCFLLQHCSKHSCKEICIICSGNNNILSRFCIHNKCRWSSYSITKLSNFYSVCKILWFCLLGIDTGLSFFPYSEFCCDSCYCFGWEDIAYGRSSEDSAIHAFVRSCSSGFSCTEDRL